MTLTVKPIDVAMASELIALLDQDLAERYPGQPINGIDATEFRSAGGYFAMAYLDNAAIACGGFRPLDASTVELKRMFVCPQFRGRGAARAVLAALESEARQRGFHRISLETGKKQPEAIALYRSCNYVDVDAFEPYANDPRSVFLGRSL